MGYILERKTNNHPAGPLPPAPLTGMTKVFKDTIKSGAVVFPAMAVLNYTTFWGAPRVIRNQTVLPDRLSLTAKQGTLAMALTFVYSATKELSKSIRDEDDTWNTYNGVIAAIISTGFMRPTWSLSLVYAGWASAFGAGAVYAYDFQKSQERTNKRFQY